MRECPNCAGCFEDQVLRCPTDGYPTDPELEGSAVIDGTYLLERCVGRGGMGTVYQARHLQLNRLFALKLIRPQQTRNPRFLHCFQNEAAALGRLRHEHIVEVTDYGIDPRGEGIPYLVMVYLQGQHLGQILKERGTLPLEEALPVLDAVAEAVDFAHQEGILHLDLKPANVFLARNGPGKPVIKILDFGLARMLGGDDSPRARELAPARSGRPGESPKHPEGILPLKQLLGAHAFEQGVGRSQLNHDTGSLDASTVVRVPAPPAPPFLEADPGTMAAGGDAFEVFEDATGKPAFPSDIETYDGSPLGGTPGYMAPETVERKPATTAMDVYAFGILAFKTLSGFLPFRGTFDRNAPRESTLPPPLQKDLNPLFSAELNEALRAPLDLDPIRRPATLRAVVEGLRRAAERQRQRVWTLRERPRRKGLALAVGVLVIGAGWAIRYSELGRRLEHFQADLAFGWMPPTPPDPRVVLVTLDEATLDDHSDYFFQRADALTQALGSILDAGATAVAVDMLLPRRFSESESLSRLVLAHRERLVLALHLREDGSPRGADCLPDQTRAALGSQERFEALFGLVNFKPDEDGRIRSLSRSTIGKAGVLEPMSVRLFRRAMPAGRGGIPDPLRLDFSINPHLFRRINWASVPEILKADPAGFRGKCVLVGVESASKEDVHLIPSIRGQAAEVSGIRLHALMLQTLLEGRSLRDAPPFLLELGMGVIAAIAAWMLLWRRELARGLALAAGATVGCLALAAGLWSGGYFLAPAAAILALALGIASALMARRLLPKRPDSSLRKPDLSIESTI